MKAAALLDGVARLTRSVVAAADADAAVDALLSSMGPCLGAPHCCLLLADPAGEVLHVVASRGFLTEGVGAEVPFGRGAAGIAAQRRRIVRVDSLRSQVRMAAAVTAPSGPREIVPPILPDVESVLAVPLVAGGRLVGVLLAESTHRSLFTGAHEAAFEAVAALVAARLAEAVVPAPDDDEPVAVPAPKPPPADRRVDVRCYAEDDSVFVGPTYVIKGVAGLVLRSMLEDHAETGRVEFTNKELRLAHADQLPWVKDNLESRLILLRRRLEEKQVGIRLRPAGRGRLLLDVEGQLALAVEAAPGRG